MSEITARSSVSRVAVHDIGDRPAVAPITLGIRLNRAPKVAAVEIGPQSIKEHQLGIGALPQQEVGRSLLSRRANEEVDVGDIRFIEEMPKSLLGELARIESAVGGQRCDASGGVDNLGPAAVVHAELEGQYVI